MKSKPDPQGLADWKPNRQPACTETQPPIPAPFLHHRDTTPWEPYNAARGTGKFAIIAGQGLRDEE
jgi:hypothetical protein